MNVEEKIKEIANYFKKKLIKGDYEVIEWDNSVCIIEIDNKFRFQIWVFMGDSSFKFYGLGYFPIIQNYYDLTLKEREEAWENYLIHENKYKNLARKKVLETQIDALKYELNRIL